ncbi:glutaminyl-tRNA synthase (glutamine-hydrolyzing) subunit A [Candidatus Woesebacteria bacterium RBG_16_36_11]|uniref:Glutamyl-tRNA(Gln) amidotransferase subunit A n=2 Tax=Candidatus Woeseibacteriota TaxID=1752722 RepID=A0A1F7XAW0_9BACT|nr:MAG: glutaminyl-tRNA synthase (glutamine-hydrolyzing) subunit A [Candidatus Woesebacteria bacterium RBG_16_36_11]OGM16502.1 MAG: glutaminyl-tRNA synthase (glutamine-hydrolyzing) subunit A [Candidatus Woesebacteria bacterium RBG_19FT_COMBO_37_29]
MKFNPPLTIEETQKGLLKKDFSAVDLVDSYLDRIKKYDKNLNAIITLAEDSAYEKAKKVDRLISDYKENAFKDYPLLGVVVIHKDMFLTKGIRTTAASNVLKDYIPSYSATTVKKFDAAGCITLAKANCDAWAHGSSGENSDFGPTKNPWNENFVAGGSSSGSAASLAANYCLIATGTDTCGSVRVPANFCGVVGLKPTYGSVSRYGVIAMASSLDSVGHFSRTVEDSRKIFEVTKGEDGLDATLKNSNIILDKSKITVGIPKEFFVKGLDKDVEKGVFAAINLLKKKGINFKEVSLPHTKYGISVYYIIQPAEVSSNLGRYDGIRFGDEREVFGDEAKRRIMLGTYVLSAGYYDAYYNQAMKVRSIIIKEVDNVFKDVDALIAPVAPTNAFKLGEKTNNPLSMYLTDIYAATANLTGIPSIAIPYGFSKNRLPLGFQIMAPKFSEDMLVSLGKMFQQEISWKPEVPNI